LIAGLLMPGQVQDFVQVSPDDALPSYSSTGQGKERQKWPPSS
jgi:hypothetical protein